MNLTAIERQVLIAISSGQTRKEIADARACALKTIDSHVQNARKRNGYRMYSQLIYMAGIARLIDTPHSEMTP